MHYSYEFKRKCVVIFRDTVRKWVRIEDAQGPEALKHKLQNKVWSVEEKYELVSYVPAGNSIKSVAINAGDSK